MRSVEFGTFCAAEDPEWMDFESVTLLKKRSNISVETALSTIGPEAVEDAGSVLTGLGFLSLGRVEGLAAH